MLNSYEHAVSPGTANNRIRQAKVYLAFSVAYNINYLAPSISDTAMFAQYLANSFKAPGTLKNYFSGAKLWVSQRGGDISPFLDPQVLEVIKGTENLSTHVPSPSLPIKIDELLLITKFLRRFTPMSLPHIAAILLGFSTFLRASNLLSSNSLSNVNPHALLRQDVISVPDGLKILVRSSKTISPKNPVLISVFPSPMSPLCPVKAWNQYLELFKPSPLGPAFVSHTGDPITPSALVKLIRMALHRAGYKNFSKFSMHSIRRGATQTAAQFGATRNELKEHGTWKSDQGLKAYLNISPSVARLMASHLPSY